MAHYVDGYVLPLPRRNVAAYRRLARKAGRIWIEYGALEVRECIADDGNPRKHTSLPQPVKLVDEEVVVFSRPVCKSR